MCVFVVGVLWLLFFLLFFNIFSHSLYRLFNLSQSLSGASQSSICLASKAIQRYSGQLTKLWASAWVNTIYFIISQSHQLRLLNKQENTWKCLLGALLSPHFCSANKAVKKCVNFLHPARRQYFTHYPLIPPLALLSPSFSYFSHSLALAFFPIPLSPPHLFPPFFLSPS